MNIGVMGGTFDPIHNGHIVVAEEARTRLNLAEVLFMPAGQPWLKADRNVTPAEHRVEMVRLAIADRPYFKLSTIEVERRGPTYTADTLVDLRDQLEPEDALYFIVGWDDLAQLPQWQKPSQLVQLCFIVAVPRPGCPPPELESLDNDIPALSQRVINLDKPEIDISASEIRDRVARGLPIGHLVPAPVERYIKQHKLYLEKGQ